MRLVIASLYALLGAIKFILSGGESNPGPPVFSRIANTMVDTISNKVKNLIKCIVSKLIPSQTLEFLNDLKNTAIWSVYMLRLFTSVTDFIGTFCSRPGLVYISQIDVSARLSNLILNLYDTMKVFYTPSELLMSAVQLTLQSGFDLSAGGFDTVLVSSLLSAATPSFIKNILFDIPRLTNAKFGEAIIPFLVEMIVFVTSLPRRLFQMFAVSKTEEGKAFVSAMMSIENMFPFSRMGKIRKDMENLLVKVRADPRLLLQEHFKNDFDGINKSRKTIEQDYLYCNKNLPSYYINMSKDFDELEKKLFANSSAQRVEPLCIVFCGPPNTGKSVFNTRLIKMYEKSGHRVYVDTIPADISNKHHMDMYDNQYIYTADDIGAQSKAQFAYLINMVSVQKYPLEAAEVKYKNTRFFNSRLMLLTTNMIPDNFGATDGIADKEALYRRMHVMSFDNVKFHEGKHSGFIQIKKYDDTMGVKKFTVRETIDLSDPSEYMGLVDKYIRHHLQQKLDQFNYNRKADEFYTAAPLPELQLQAGNRRKRAEEKEWESWGSTSPDENDPFIYKIKNSFALFMEQDGVQMFYNRTADVIADMNQVITNLFNGKLPRNVSISKMFFIIFACVLFSGGVYFAVSKLSFEPKEENTPFDEKGYCECCFTGDKNPYEVYGDRYDEYMSGYCVKKPKHESEYYTPEQRERFRRNFFAHTSEKHRKIVDIFSQGFINVKGEVTTPIPQLNRYSKNVMQIQVFYTNIEGRTCDGSVRGLFSFNKLLTVAHVLDGCDYSKDIFITATYYDQRVYDYMLVKLIQNCPAEDWCMFELPRTAPRFFQRINFGTNNRICRSLCLVVGDANVVDLGEDITQFGIVTKYKIGSFETQIAEDDLMYNYEGAKLCGSPLVTKDGNLIGLHVAKVVLEDQEVKGVSRLFSLESRNKIIEEFQAEGPVVPIKFDGGKISGAEFEGEYNYFSPDKTKYVKSRVYGIFPPYRKPALLLDKNKKDTDILSQKMLELPGEVQLEPLEYAEDSIDDILPAQSRPLDEDELIAGNPEGLGRIDPRTSCGVDLPGTKQFYIDYENRRLRENCTDKIKQYVNDIVTHKYNFSDTAAVVLKDELKNVEDFDDPLSMPKKVRIFTNYHLISTLLIRYFLGDLMVKVAKEKFLNGIMIGINPLSRDWERFYKCMTKFGRRLFDGDYSNYDNYMHPAFQRKLNKVLRKRVQPDYAHFNKVFGTDLVDNDQVMLVYDQMMECIISTPITSNSKKIITTHGLPSGAAITAFYNSCINKMYIAYGYRILVPGKDLSFLRMDIKDAVYGDDVLINVRPEIRAQFNPYLYSQVMSSLGLGFTPADKGEWTKLNMFKDILDCTFLKRGFAYHDKIQAIVAPLDYHSMEGTLNYVSDYYNNDELTEIKIHNYQREAFLHTSEYYTRSMAYVKKILDEKDLFVQLLREDYLIELYKDDNYSQLLQLH